MEPLFQFHDSDVTGMETKRRKPFDVEKEGLGAEEAAVKA